MSAQAEASNVKLVRRTWNDEYLKELQNFDGSDGCVADQVDASSGAFHLLTNVERTASCRPDSLLPPTELPRKLSIGGSRTAYSCCAKGQAPHCGQFVTGFRTDCGFYLGMLFGCLSCFFRAFCASLLFFCLSLLFLSFFPPLSPMECLLSD